MRTRSVGEPMEGGVEEVARALVAVGRADGVRIAVGDVGEVGVLDGEPQEREGAEQARRLAAHDVEADVEAVDEGERLPARACDVGGDGAGLLVGINNVVEGGGEWGGGCGGGVGHEPSGAIVAGGAGA